MPTRYINHLMGEFRVGKKTCPPYLTGNSEAFRHICFLLVSVILG